MLRPLSLMVSALALATCVTAPASTSLQPKPVKDVVISDLKSPWSLAFIDDDTVLISEKEGDLLKVNLSSGQRVAVTGLPDDLYPFSAETGVRGGNSGLFDILLDPDFSDNQHIYLAYSAGDGTVSTTKVIRATLRGTELSDIKTLLVAEPFTQDEQYHYGGGIIFAPDGTLIITVGERLFTEADQPDMPIAQNLSDPRGKIHRINRDGSIPSDNPDFGEGAVPSLYAIGIRAAQGLAMNAETNEIWFSEHGTHQGDELNRLTPGANYGWPVHTTGRYRDADYVPAPLADRTFTDPDWYWTHTVAPTGLAIYSGREFEAWNGDILVPGLSRGSLWRMDLEGGEIVATEGLFTHDRVRSRKVAQSPDGTLYMLTDTHFTIVPGRRPIDNGGPSGELIRIRNAAVSSK